MSDRQGTAAADGPGPVVLFGSGETSASGQKGFDWLFRQLAEPPRVAILETPAGFELNSERVAGRIGDFLLDRLQNYRPRITLVPARRRNTALSPESAEVVAPLLDSNVLFLGPGSPSYAVRQLHDSLAWHTLVAKHRLGAALALASAATIAIGRFALPVYEIYKVGEDPHWKPGLDLFAPFGLSLVVVPHWNNADGGGELDTSRCFMGRVRFDPLIAMLPADVTILGLDEHTSLAVDFAAACCRVLGRGSVTLLRNGAAAVYPHGRTFAWSELGPFRLPEPQTGIPAPVWQTVSARPAEPVDPAEPPAEVQRLAALRQAARERRDWPAADALRGQIEALGWTVQDTPAGPRLATL
jgi:hypothetical protein